MERLLELHWRLRRVHAIERGIIEKQTIGLKSQRMVARIKAAKKADHFALMGKENPFASTNPYIVQFAREKVDELVLLLKDGVDDFKAIFKDLGDAMGRDHEQMPHNVGGAVAWLIFAAPKHGVSSEQIRTQLVEILGELVENLAQHETYLLEDMLKADEAEVQSLRGVTDPQRLRALSAMERGLQGQMLEVLSELERRVRWRRVVEALANK
ncbi:MAG: hypothetical protein H6716_24675 [Polyangiaceae bacterium]|nr:hypothetical protein [Polyangiaceae bacterium]